MQSCTDRHYETNRRCPQFCERDVSFLRPNNVFVQISPCVKNEEVELVAGKVWAPVKVL